MQTFGARAEKRKVLVPKTVADVLPCLCCRDFGQNQFVFAGSAPLVTPPSRPSQRRQAAADHRVYKRASSKQGCVRRFTPHLDNIYAETEKKTVFEPKLDE